MRRLVSEWRATSSFLLEAQRGPLVLGIVVSPNPEGSGWAAIGVQTNRDAETVEAVFDEHAHVVIIKGAALEDALGAAREYAGRWLLADEEDKLPDCSCKRIEDATLDAIEFGLRTLRAL